MFDYKGHTETYYITDEITGACSEILAANECEAERIAMGMYPNRNPEDITIMALSEF